MASSYPDSVPLPLRCQCQCYIALINICLTWFSAGRPQSAAGGGTSPGPGAGGWKVHLAQDTPAPAKPQRPSRQIFYFIWKGSLQKSFKKFLWLICKFQMSSKTFPSSSPQINFQCKWISKLFRIRLLSLRKKFLCHICFRNCFKP